MLQVRAGRNVVGCISACGRFNTDQYCCRGKWPSASACNPKRWPVDYAAVFKRAEPYACSYAFDDATGTFTCYRDCNYRITFGLTPVRAKARSASNNACLFGLRATEAGKLSGDWADRG